METAGELRARLIHEIHEGTIRDLVREKARGVVDARQAEAFLNERKENPPCSCEP